MCGLRTRPRTDVDPPRVELPSAGGILSHRPWGDNLVVFVCFLLQYCSSVWKNIGTLSNVTYPERLDIRVLHAESLELWRLKFDLTMMFRTIRGYCALDRCSFFTLHNSSTRGNKFKLMKQFSRVNYRVFSFASRCIDAWNSLSDDVDCAPSVPVFKYHLKRFIWRVTVLLTSFSLHF